MAKSFKYKGLISIYAILFLLSSCQSPTVSICSWNIQHFGATKSDQQIAFIANTIKDYDIIAIQEVVAGKGGMEAVIRLHDALTEFGHSWDYSISEPTSSSANFAERYAFLWRSDKVRLAGEPWLDDKYNAVIEREPYLATFRVRRKRLTLVNYHAIPKQRQPETEIKYFKFFPEEYAGLALIFCGDFNLPSSHTVFNPLKKMGYQPAFVGQKTSLRHRCLDDGCLASELDNFFFPASRFRLTGKGVIHFYEAFEDFEDARRISDHVPIYIVVRLK